MIESFLLCTFSCQCVSSVNLLFVLRFYESGIYSSVSKFYPFVTPSVVNVCFSYLRDLRIPSMHAVLSAMLWKRSHCHLHGAGGTTVVVTK